MKEKKPAQVIATKVADKNNVVHTTIGGGGGYCERVCPECPWRKRNSGNFPAKAFLHSVHTSYDMAQETFGCHMSGTDTPRTCAGFLLRGADDNLSVRIARATGRIGYPEPEDGLHESYKAMAIANGVKPSNPRLKDCMPEARDFKERGRAKWLKELAKINRRIRKKT